MKEKALNIVYLYLVISLTWILVSDRLIIEISSVLNVPVNTLQTGKGFFFVFTTALVLSFAIKRQHRFLFRYAEQYKGLFHSNPNPLWIYDIHTLKFLEVNNAATRVYGYS